MKRYILLIITLCFVQSGHAKVYFHHLGTSEGLSQLSVMSISQDELGRMWFGTLEGLNCYDGDRILSYKPSAAYPLLGNQVFNIVNDRQGNLFFTSDNKLIHFDIYKEDFTCLRENNTTALFAHDHRVWMASADSIFTWNGTKNQFDFFYTHPLISAISSIYIDADNNLWIGSQDGLYLIENNNQPEHIIPRGSVRSLYQDSHGNMWIAMFRDGAYLIPYQKETPKHITEGENSLSSNDVRSFIEDNQGNLWIATFGGLNKLDTQGRFTYYKEDILPGSLQHSSIFPVYKDVQGTIWLGTYFSGVHYFNPDADFFTYYARGANRDDCLSFSIIGKMVEDKHGDVWICTGGGGLNRLNRKTGKFVHYLMDGTPNSIPFNSLMCIEYDEAHDRLYIGTYSKGLFSLDIASGKIKHFSNFSYYGASLMHLEIHGKQLYFLTTEGLFIMDTDRGEITRLPIPKAHSSRGSAFTVDANNYLWIAQRDQLLRINLHIPQDIQKYKYGENGLGKFPVSRIIGDQQGNIYLGTIGSGLFHYDSIGDTFVAYTAEDKWLQSNYCYDIALFGPDYLIVSGEQGLTILSLQKKIVKPVSLKNRLYFSAINEGCGLLVCRDGEVFVGGMDGMTSFMGNRLFDSIPSYNIYFSSLAVNNQPIQVGTSGILQNILPLTTNIDLKHYQSSIAINFTSNNYIQNLQQSNYEYKLEGFDNDWIKTTEKKIVYTNLNPGHYILFVREQEGEHTAQLKFVIHSPWYATWAAYIGYALIISVVIYTLIRNRQAKMRLQYSLEKEKMEKKKNEEITQAKLQFFANISHDFRTPLTLIMSQLEMLLQHKGNSLFVHTRLLKVYRNTFQLRELISELLDFRKFEKGDTRLKVSYMDLIPFLRYIYNDFQELASSQNIDFSFTPEIGTATCWFDAKQLRRVFSNLLSNAFKYTPEGGAVTMTIDRNEEYIEVKVMDTGQGIEEEAIDRIFDYFYQADKPVSKDPGTGIGLALTKGLVEMHHGQIAVRSVVNKGSTFTVTLPLSNRFVGDEHAVITDVSEPTQEISSFSMPKNKEERLLPTEMLPEEIPQTDENENKKSRILIIEDNEELLQVLSSLLSPLYKVSIALNGKDGLAKAMEEQPDLILSDIMMPIMSGIEMCLKIKQNFDLCHIPVVLLTAFTTEDKELEGLQCGADDYIGKPFSNKLLISKIANVLRNRNLLRKKYGQIFGERDKSNDIAELALTAIDRKFLSSLNTIIGERLSDSDFNVGTLAREIGVSRSSLYNKIKALTCMTPNEFILNFRLNRASFLLKNHPEFHITEIAYQVGFSSLRYFRHCFKAQFNKTPQEYRNQ